MKANVLGAARLTAHGWDELSERGIITVRQGRDDPWQVFIPETSKRAALLEGHQFVRWVTPRMRPVGVLAGTGAPLLLRERPYNCLDRLCSLASAVMDRGLIESVTIDAAGCGCEVRLARPIQPSDQHRVLVWRACEGGRPSLLDRSSATALERGRCWRIPWPEPEVPAVVALAYGGHWLGAAVSEDDPAKVIDPLLTNADRPNETAALLRWTRLPVLAANGDDQLPAFARFSRAFPAEVLDAWLNDSALQDGLEFRDDEGRREVEHTILRSVFLRWSPGVTQCQSIVQRLTGSEQDPLGHVLLAMDLLLIDPLLAGQIAIHWLSEQGPPAGFSTARYLQILEHQHVGDRSRVYATDDIMERFLEQAADSMRVGPEPVAPQFVADGVASPALRTLRGGTLTAYEENNLRVALQLGSFREYLGLRVLRELAGMFKS